MQASEDTYNCRLNFRDFTKQSNKKVPYLYHMIPFHIMNLSESYTYLCFGLGILFDSLPETSHEDYTERGESSHETRQ